MSSDIVSNALSSARGTERAIWLATAATVMTHIRLGSRIPGMFTSWLQPGLRFQLTVVEPCPANSAGASRDFLIWPAPRVQCDVQEQAFL